MVSQVSTRGVKFKFSEGERVLCYEPDPTKAKVLYESKVLDLVVSRDERGRKVPEYLIHFFGWNSSWDRCVREEFILPYTEENSELQAKLASEAALTIKGKRKYKLPPLIKETLAKKQCAEEEKQKLEKSESPVDTSSSDSSDDDSEREVIINIPDILKKQLDEDHVFITQKNKFVKLPCKPNVVSILEAYVKHSSSKFLCVSPPKNAKNGQQFMPDDVKNKLNLCKEAMDGIRIYFDFTLPHLLLYRQEKKQHYTEGINCRPVDCSYVWEPREAHETPVVKVEKIGDESAACNSENNTPFVKMEQQTVTSRRSQNRKSPRNRSSKKKSTVKEENITNGETDQKSENVDQAMEVKNVKTPKQRPKLQSTRVLRSSEKQKPQPQKEGSSSAPKKEISLPAPKKEISSPAPKKESSLTPKKEISSPALKKENSLTPKKEISSPPPVITDNKQSQAHPELSTPESTNPPRVTRKSTLQNMSPPRISSPTLPTQPSQPLTEEKPVSSNSNPSRVLPPLPLPSNCISSSNSSSHSTFSNPIIGHQFHLINNAALLQEILSWRLLPPHLYEPIPAAPSLIYGAQHLLRLFVKLPELLSKMNMSRKKLIPLLDILESLLQFIAEKKNELFHFSAYSDSYDEEHDKSVCSTK